MDQSIGLLYPNTCKAVLESNAVSGKKHFADFVSNIIDL